MSWGRRHCGRGQDQIPVHIFPFRMTEADLAAYAGSKWHGFWRNLKEGYDAFEATRLPPQIGVCGTHYAVGAAQSLDDVLSMSVSTDACGPERPIVTASNAPGSKASHWIGKRRKASSRTASRDAARSIVRRASSGMVKRRPHSARSAATARRMH